jgi:hypothetical protein
MAKSPKKSVLFINGVLNKEVAEEFSEVQEVLHDSALDLLAPLFDACFERITKNVKSAKGLSILYFASHGTSDGIRIRHRVPQQANSERDLTADMITAAVQEFRKQPLDLMLFNCCDSIEIAEELTVCGGARAAIGWKQDVSHNKCKFFARSFFEKLKIGFDASDHVAIENAFEQIKADFDDAVHLFSVHDHQIPFDVTIELCKKTLQASTRIKKSLCALLFKKDVSDLEALSVALLNRCGRKDDAITVFCRFVAMLENSRSRIQEGDFNCLRILADLCYIKSLPTVDLAIVSHSLRKAIESIGNSSSPRKVRLRSRMTIESICSVMQKARSELKAKESATNEFEFYYNRDIESGDISILFEDRLVLLDCMLETVDVSDQQKEEVLVNALTERGINFRGSDELQGAIEYLKEKRSTIAVLLREDQYKSWKPLCDKFLLVPVVRPRNETEHYRRVQEKMQSTNEYLKRIRTRG